MVEETTSFNTLSPLKTTVVAMERWKIQHYVSCVRSFYQTNSVTAQRVYQRQLNIDRHGHVQSHFFLGTEI